MGNIGRQHTWWCASLRITFHTNYKCLIWLIRMKKQHAHFFTLWAKGFRLEMNLIKYICSIKCKTFGHSWSFTTVGHWYVGVPVLRSLTFSLTLGTRWEADHFLAAQWKATDLKSEKEQPSLLAMLLAMYYHILGEPWIVASHSNKQHYSPGWERLNFLMLYLGWRQCCCKVLLLVHLANFEHFVLFGFISHFIKAKTPAACRQICYSWAD